MSTQIPAPGSRARQLEGLKLLCERGVELCRRGRWQEGLSDLACLEHGKVIQGVPSACYAYLGYGLARYRKKVPEGVKLCRMAVRMELYQTENFELLARTCLLAPRYRRLAYAALREGLAIDPTSPELRSVHRELGVRRPPVLPFLARSNVLNRLFGAVRHLLLSSSGSEPSSAMIASTART
ncbi:MAG: hypothetical protein AAFX50_12735 [Acidobacteriota bacterium]